MGEPLHPEDAAKEIVRLRERLAESERSRKARGLFIRILLSIAVVVLGFLMVEKGGQFVGLFGVFLVISGAVFGTNAIRHYD
jgi:hypothetical protein